MLHRIYAGAKNVENTSFFMKKLFRGSYVLLSIILYKKNIIKDKEEDPSIPIVPFSANIRSDTEKSI